MGDGDFSGLSAPPPSSSSGTSSRSDAAFPGRSHDMLNCLGVCGTLLRWNMRRHPLVPDSCGNVRIGIPRKNMLTVSEFPGPHHLLETPKCLDGAYEPSDLGQIFEDHFSRAMHKVGFRDFHAVAKAMVKSLGVPVSTESVVRFYYSYWKLTIGYQQWKEEMKRNPPREKKSWVDQFLDMHDESCFVCKKEGELLCCDFCPKSYHLGCVQPPIKDVPETDWRCPDCVKSGRVRRLSVDH